MGKRGKSKPKGSSKRLDRKTHADDDDWSFSLGSGAGSSTVHPSYGTTVIYKRPRHVQRKVSPVNRKRPAKLLSNHRSRPRFQRRRRFHIQKNPVDGQVANSGGGFSFEISTAKQLERFLILGSAGSYYASKDQTTISSAAALEKFVVSDGATAVNLIQSIAFEGRALKKNNICYALAAAVKFGNAEAKQLAYGALNDVAGTPTLLFEFLAACKHFKVGWGRAQRNAVAQYYISKPPQQCTYQVSKYPQRNGWSNHDVLRLAHPKAKTPAMRMVLAWIAKGLKALDIDQKEEAEFVFVPSHDEEAQLKSACQYLLGVEKLKAMNEASAQEVASFLSSEKEAGRSYVREHIPTCHLKSASVWAVLLEGMPLMALIRNLGKLTSLGLLEEGSTRLQNIVARITDNTALRRARVHPFSLFLAYKAYKNPDAEERKGSLTWSPKGTILRALDSGFYQAFKNVTPTGKRFLGAVDVSGSMSFCSIQGLSGVTAREASAVQAMTLLRTEDQCRVYGFSDTFRRLPMDRNDDLEAVQRKTNNLPFASTDCSLPMVFATEHALDVDVFVVLTDNETNCNRIAPNEALNVYRKEAHRPHAKLVVVAMCTNRFSIADPADPYMVDVVGCDAALPEIIREVALL